MIRITASIISNLITVRQKATAPATTTRGDQHQVPRIPGPRTRFPPHPNGETSDLEWLSHVTRRGQVSGSAQDR